MTSDTMAQTRVATVTAGRSLDEARYDSYIRTRNNTSAQAVMKIPIQQWDLKVDVHTLSK